MTINDAKQIKLADYLQSLGYTPIKQQGKSLWYKSPLRNETDASFKVNTEHNQWYDFGIGKGGNIIDLAEQLYKSSDVSYLIHQIGHNVPSMVSASHGVVKPKQSSATFENLQVLPLSHPALIRYLQDRCIDIEVAKSVCKEVHYEVNNKCYFAIGFPNCGGGYELRNPFFKGCIAPKDISHFYANEPKKICFLFEGFIDFLSFMTLRRIQSPQYNGLSNQEFDIEFCNEYS